MKNHIYHIVRYFAAFFLLLCFFPTSCNREEIPVVSQDAAPFFSVSEALACFVQRFSSIVPVNFTSDSCCNDPEHHHQDTKSFTGSKTLTPLWEKAAQVTTDRSVVVNVPIREQGTIDAILYA